VAAIAENALNVHPDDAVMSDCVKSVVAALLVKVRENQLMLVAFAPVGLLLVTDAVMFIVGEVLVYLDSAFGSNSSGSVAMPSRGAPKSRMTRRPAARVALRAPMGITRPWDGFPMTLSPGHHY